MVFIFLTRRVDFYPWFSYYIAMKYHIMALIALSFCILHPQATLADWIMIENGDRISGEIQENTADSVTILSPSLGALKVPKSKIYSIHQGQAPRVTARALRTGKPEYTQTPTTPEAITESAPTPVVAKAEPAPKKAKANTEGYKWTGRVSAGGNVQDGNSRTKSITADADIKARNKKNRFGLGGEANWAEDQGNRTDNDQQIYANYDRFLTDKWFVGARQSFEKDEFEELDLRSQSGLFAGYQFYEQDDLNLQVKAGPDYIFEDFENGNSENDLALSWALDYDQKFNDGGVQLFHKHEISTPFDDTEAFLFKSETGARVPISQRLDASAQVDFDWDNSPSEGVREDDTTYSLKVGYGW